MNGNYEPDNLRRATAKVQGDNRRTNHFVEDMDEKKISLGLAAEKYGLKEDTIYKRFKEGLKGEALFRSSRKFITVDGKNLHEWSDATGIGYNTLLFRIHKGYRGEKLFKPVSKAKTNITKKRISQAQSDSKV